MTAPQNVRPPNPPQFDALRPTTTIVTVGIGGNDIGFVSLILSCVSALPSVGRCQDRFVANGVDVISNRIAATRPKVTAVLQGIHRRAPRARVFVVGYPTVVPASGPGCWPSVPFTGEDVPYLRTKELEINAMLAGAAAEAGAIYVDVHTPSAGHDACESPNVRWVEPVIPGAPAEPLHPNGTGMAQMAEAVTRAIRAGR